MIELYLYFVTIVIFVFQSFKLIKKFVTQPHKKIPNLLWGIGCLMLALLYLSLLGQLD